MTKNKKKKKINSNIIFGIIFVFVILALIIIFICSKYSNKEKNVDSSVKVKEFETVDVLNVLKAIDEQKDFVLLIAYPGCQVCDSYYPILQRAQSINNFNGYYLNIKETNESSKEWKKFLALLIQRQSFTITTDGKDTKIDDTIGNITKKYGYTPVTVVVNDGKVVNSHIGSLSSKELDNFIDDIVK